jgi:hypothetical protein
MILFRKEKIHSFSHTLPDGRIMIFDAFWPTFRPEVDYAFWVDLLPLYSRTQTIRILGPFWRQNNRKDLEAIRYRDGKWDFFITGENRDNPTDLATKCIGFRIPTSGAELRFPYWQWYLTWQGFETDPPYRRFGTRLSIDRLMTPISESFEALSREEFDQMNSKAVLLTSHFKRHRRRLWRITNTVLGCDAFGRKIRPTDLPKRELLAPYPFNLCPENKAEQGYITEKTPEAFLSGCVPIVYCHPDDLALDFNPNAVVNLHGLSTRQIKERLAALGSDYDHYRSLRTEPLVRSPLSLQPLLDFLAP